MNSACIPFTRYPKIFVCMLIPFLSGCLFSGAMKEGTESRVPCDVQTRFRVMPSGEVIYQVKEIETAQPFKVRSIQFRVISAETIQRLATHPPAGSTTRPMILGDAETARVIDVDASRPET